MFETVVKTFEVHNQPLYEYPDTADFDAAIIQGVVEEGSISQHLQRAMIAALGKKDVRKFHNLLNAGERFPSITPPRVSISTISSVVPDSVNDHIESLPIVDGIVSYVNSGGITNLDWVNLSLYHSDDFLLIPHPSSPSLWIEDDYGQHSAHLDTLVKIQSTGKLFTSWVYETGGEETRIEYESAYTDPVPDGSYYVFYWYETSPIDPNVRISHVDYMAVSETDFDPGFIEEFGEFDVFPPIPLRLNGQNFNGDDPNPLLDKKDITKACKVLGIDPNQLINNIVKDPNVVDNLDKIDHIYANFGVRMWDTSEAAARYLYLFFDMVYRFQGGGVDTGGNLNEDLGGSEYKVISKISPQSYFSLVYHGGQVLAGEYDDEHPHESPECWVREALNGVKYQKYIVDESIFCMYSDGASLYVGTEATGKVYKDQVQVFEGTGHSGAFSLGLVFGKVVSCVSAIFVASNRGALWVEDQNLIDQFEFDQRYYVKTCVEFKGQAIILGWDRTNGQCGYFLNTTGDLAKENWQAWRPVFNNQRFMRALPVGDYLYIVGSNNYTKSGGHQSNAACIWRVKNLSDFFNGNYEVVDNLGFEYASCLHSYGNDVYYGTSTGWRSRTPGASLIKFPRSLMYKSGEGEVRDVLCRSNGIYVATRTDKTVGKVVIVAHPSGTVIQPDEDPLPPSDPVDPIGEDHDFSETIYGEYVPISFEVETPDYQYKFACVQIRKNSYPIEDVMADEELKRIYYANSNQFYGDGQLKDENFTSSGALIYHVGYMADTSGHVEAYVDTGITQRSVPRVSEDAYGYDMMKVTRRITYNGKVYTTDGTLKPLGQELLPEYAYKRIYKDNAWELQEAATELPDKTDTIYYYRVSSGGLEEIEVTGPNVRFAVIDAQTGQSGDHVTKIADVNELTIPFAPNIVYRLENREAADCMIASIHASMYVADVQTTSLPWWAIVGTAIITVVTAWTGAGGLIGQAMIRMLTTVIVGLFISKFVVAIATRISPYVAAAVMIAAFLISKDLTNLTKLIQYTIDNLSQVLLKALDIVKLVVTDTFNDDFRQIALDQENLDQEHKEKYNELTERSYFKESSLESTSLIESLMSDRRVEVTPVDPEAYYMQADNIGEIGFDMLDVDNQINKMYN